MIDKPALRELLQFVAITSAAEAVKSTTAHQPLALPNDFQLHDIEQYLPTRRRARGEVVTPVLPDFANYVGAFKEDGATCFVSPKDMEAKAVLNIGTKEAPGHADNTASYKPPMTAAYKALRAVATGQGIGQRTVAEFIEDWGVTLDCLRTNGDEQREMTTVAAVAAVRNITIEHLKKAGASEQQLSAEHSTFEKVAVADGDNPLPTIIKFHCVPYLGLMQRTFVLRLGVFTGDREPKLSLRIVKDELHSEQMADELAGNVRQALQGTVPVVIGSYAARK